MLDEQALPRGVRNNNPGNIDFNPLAFAKDPWLGEVGLEPAPKNGGRARFTTFKAPEYGIRAIVKVIRSYRKRGLDTIEKWIATWAPTGDANDPKAYAQVVEKDAGWPLARAVPDTEFPRIVPAVVRAIVRVENAGFRYPDDVMTRGVTMGLA